MIIRRKSDDRLLKARLNFRHPIGRYHDPALEAKTGGIWYRLGPTEMAYAFEIISATELEMDQLALLVEYGLEFAVDFALAEDVRLALQTS